MNCRDFERIWNKRLDVSASLPGDAGSGGTSGSELALWEHAVGCSECRQKAAGYQALERSILAWGPAPAPRADLADRILLAARAQAPSARRWSLRRHPGRPVIRFVAAASIMAIITVGLMTRFSIDRARDRDRLASAKPGHSQINGPDRSDGPNLNAAFASATEASWDLARSASEPAARLSRQFLEAATEPRPLQPHESSGGALSVPSLDAFAPDSASAVATMQQVGDHLANGVRPLSSTARRAFGFLVGAPPPKREM
jgi:hypothetical protein